MKDLDFLGSYQVDTVGIAELLKRGNYPGSETVWLGEDGSYAVGNAGLWGPEHEDGAQFVEAGTVADYTVTA